MTVEEAKRLLLEISDAFREAAEQAGVDHQKSATALDRAAKLQREFLKKASSSPTEN